MVMINKGGSERRTGSGDGITLRAQGCSYRAHRLGQIEDGTGDERNVHGQGAQSVATDGRTASGRRGPGMLPAPTNEDMDEAEAGISGRCTTRPESLRVTMLPLPVAGVRHYCDGTAELDI